MFGCNECRQVTSGDCGKHPRVRDNTDNVWPVRYATAEIRCPHGENCVECRLSRAEKARDVDLGSGL